MEGVISPSVKTAEDVAEWDTGCTTGGEADVGSHVDADRAGGGFRDGDHIGEISLGKPAGGIGDIGQEGKGGQSTADGEQSGLEEFVEQS